MIWTKATVRTFETETGRFGVVTEKYDGINFISAEDSDETFTTREEAEREAAQYVEIMQDQDAESGRTWELSFIHCPA